MMGRVKSMWEDELESVEDAFIDGRMTQEQFEDALEHLVPYDEIQYYVDGCLEAREDHGQFGVGA